MSRFSECTHARWEQDNANYSEADIPRYEACPKCAGRGLIGDRDSGEQDECEQCWGAGEIECPTPSVSRPERQ